MWGVVVLAAGLASSATLTQQDTLLRADEIRTACSPSVFRELQLRSLVEKDLFAAFCRWRVPTSPGSAVWSDLTGFESLRSKAVADSVRKYNWSSSGAERSIAATGGDRSAGTPGLPSASGLSGLTGSVLWGLTDFVVERAQREAFVWALPVVHREICVADHRWPETCRVLSEQQERVLSRQGLRILAAAARLDLLTLPLALLPDSAGADKQLLRLALLTAGDIVRGEPPMAALLRRGRAIEDSTCRQRLPGWRLLAVVHSLDTLDLRAGFDNLVKQAWWAGGTFRIGCEAITLPQARLKLAGASSELVEAVQQSRRVLSLLSDAVQTLDELRDALEDVSDGTVDSLARRAHRVRLVRAVQRVVTSLAQAAGSPPGASVVDSVFGFAEALAAEDWPTALVRAGRLVSATNANLRSAFDALATIAAATDADGVKEALEAIALPPGSWRAKRARSSRWAGVGAYLGSGVGLERDVGPGVWSGSAGLRLPIGLDYEISEGVLLFVQVLDLGTLASWRFDHSDGVEDRPNVGFAQVAAPGLFVAAPIRSAPFTVLMGADYVPDHRDLTGDGTSSSALRVAIMFGVDVPLFSFARRR